MIFFIVGLAVWYACGVASVIYWWTSEYDFTNNEIAFTLFEALFGPLAFLMGWSVHGKSKPKRRTVLMKMRSTK